ncbi:hypothetical protein ACIPSA_19195 [Streptomyces sp. NPDC086549]|uniref:hypothetical protein n=1 Tax=Streptomyces sp. NPDC086549 TaxID=3365752 RepID=UPI0037FB45C9
MDHCRWKVDGTDLSSPSRRTGTCAIAFAASGTYAVFPVRSLAACAARSARTWSCMGSSAGVSTSPTRERVMVHSFH